MWWFKKRNAKFYCGAAKCGKLLTAGNCEELTTSYFCNDCLAGLKAASEIRNERTCQRQEREERIEALIERIPELIERYAFEDTQGRPNGNER